MTCLTSTPKGLETLLQGLSLDPMPEYGSHAALTKPVAIWKSYLTQILSPLVDCDAATIQEAISTTTEPSLGDLALILPRLKLKNHDNEALKKFAFDLCNQFPASPLFLQPWVDGIHIRMIFSPEILPRLLLPYISDQSSDYGHDASQGLQDVAAPEQRKKRVIVEFSSPNLAKDFDGNHLRSTLLGAFVANLYESMGWEVIRINYLGDWGKQVGLLAVGFEKFGSKEKLEAEGIHHMLEVFSQISKLFEAELEARDKAKQNNEDTAEIEGKGIFAERDAFVKKLEDNDPDALALWTQFRDITIKDLTEGYARLGIKFDDYSGESQIQHETIVEVENMLKEKGVMEESEGSWVIDFLKHGAKKGLGTQIARGRDGVTRYLLRDIAAVVDRSRKYDFDKMIYVVSSRQDNHFQQLFTAVELMGRPDLKDKLQHVNFGALQGLKGDLLGAILDQTTNKVVEAQKEEQDDSEASNEENKPFSDVELVAALLTQDMSGRRGHGYAFESKKAVASSSYNGMFLQKALSKLTDLISELQADSIGEAEPDYEALKDDSSADLLRYLAQFPDVVAATYKSLEPHTLLSFLFKIVDCVYLLGEEDGGDDEEGEGEGESENEAADCFEDQGESSPGEKKAQLLLYKNTKSVLENGLKLLGFPVTLMQ